MKLLCTLFLMVAPVTAMEGWELWIPHGVTIFPGHSTVCQTCHTTPNNNSVITNPFGYDVVRTLMGISNPPNVYYPLRPDWKRLYLLDSDADGFTNGEELGDPNGIWKNGDLTPQLPITLPGDSTSHPEIVHINTNTTLSDIKLKMGAR